MSCLTSFDSPAFGLANPGQACSGHGTCLNVTLENESQPRYLCACDSGWNGVADMFDLRIAVVNGTVFTLDCPNSVVTHSVLWGLAFANSLLRECTIVSAFLLLLYEGRYKRKKTFYRILTEGHLVPIILFDMIISTPLLIIAAVRKLFYLDVFGTDVLMTLSAVFGIWLGTLGFSVFEHQTFKALTRGALMNVSERQRLDSMHLRLLTTAWITYSIVVVPTLAALALNKIDGPITSNEFILLLLRNIGFILWYIFFGLAARSVALQAARILNSLSVHSKDGSDGSSKASPKQDAALNVVEFLKQNDKELATRSIFMLFVWSATSVPQLWPFHGYFMAILSSIAAFKVNPSQVVLRSRYRLYALKTSPPIAVPSPPASGSKNVIAVNAQ
jgi:hypothetical protein